jgi:hypothetical protein
MACVVRGLPPPGFWVEARGAPQLVGLLYFFLASSPPAALCAL